MNSSEVTSTCGIRGSATGDNNQLKITILNFKLRNIKLKVLKYNLIQPTFHHFL